MLKPRIPDNEHERMETLRALELLDTVPEERFDRVTRLARRLFDVPIVLVSIVDTDRQWFKSKQGLDATETSREISFCGHSILGDEAFVIPDASLDQRFSDNPLVTDDPRIRFYAGQPLSAPNGCRLGTLCLIDQAPREPSEEDLELLGDLASMIEDEIASIQTATLDPLTGLSNRAGFNLLAEKSFQLCRRMNRPASAMFFDLDDFKHINDALGHSHGDQVLTDFASLLLESFRESDTIARLGGDEFVVFLSGATIAETDTALRRLDDSIRRYNVDVEPELALRFSVGAATYDRDVHTSLSELLRDADRKMYEGKRAKNLAR